MPFRPALGAIVLASALTACAVEPVKPWQRGDLAHADMQPDPGLVEEAVIRDHVFVSKEAASLGPGLAGSGCGCN